MSDKAMPLDDARKDALKDTAARKRMAALFDSDTFVEVGALVKNGCDGAGVITGYGLVDGSPVYAFAQDTSVRNGAVGAAHGSKIKKIYERSRPARRLLVFMIPTARQSTKDLTRWPPTAICSAGRTTFPALSRRFPWCSVRAPAVRR